MISGKTTLIAHVGFPTFAFKSPMIYNPWFEKNDIDAVVVPMGVKPDLFDPFIQASEALAGRLAQHYPDVEVTVGSKDPEGYDLVVNDTPLGMRDDDPLPMDVDRIAPTTFVADVVMKQTITPFLQAAIDRGCRIQVGQDMLYEQIPAYLEFFGYGSPTPDELRAVSQIPE
jgi:shikimate dehydrogenase